VLQDGVGYHFEWKMDRTGNFASEELFFCSFRLPRRVDKSDCNIFPLCKNFKFSKSQNFQNSPKFRVFKLFSWFLRFFRDFLKVFPRFIKVFQIFSKQQSYGLLKIFLVFPKIHPKFYQDFASFSKVFSRCFEDFHKKYLIADIK
jgi:hypothetical protein